MEKKENKFATTYKVVFPSISIIDFSTNIWRCGICLDVPA